MHYSKIKVLVEITHKKSLRGIYLYFDKGDINLPIFISFLCHFFFKNHFCNVMPLVLERNLCESALFWQPVALNYSCWIFAKIYSMQELKNWPNSWIRYSYFWEANSQWSKYCVDIGTTFDTWFEKCLCGSFIYVRL